MTRRPDSVIARRSFMLAAGGAVLGAPALRAQTAVELVFYHYQTGGAQRTLRAILDRFQADNPGIMVRDIFAQSEQITTQVQAAVAARRPVDAAQVIGKNILFFTANLPAAPINEDRAANEWLARYLPNFLDLGRVGDDIFSLPHSYGTPQIYMNLDLFRQAGVDGARAPATWDEVIAAAIRIRERTNRAGIAHLHAANKDYGTMLWVMNNGADYLSPDGMRAMFGSPRGIEAIQTWADLAVRHRVMPVANDQQWTAAFRAGQMGMYMTSSAGLRSSVEAARGRYELGVAKYPTFGDRPRRVPASGAALMMFAPPGPRRQATVRMFEYFSRRDVANLWSRETGYMPLSRDPLEDPAMAHYVREFPLVRSSIEQMAETVETARWAPNGAIEAQIEVSNLISALWAGRGTAAELVPAAIERINGILARLNPA
ncbi:extracellular solute-binding protein [Falsiroseomonas sp.]|uniref:extracellular solute-binding protein n=1 Tax=Falsiroseomonas sp. TaxID=2870721 RepID=UPI0034A3C97E